MMEFGLDDYEPDQLPARATSSQLSGEPASNFRPVSAIAGVCLDDYEPTSAKKDTQSSGASMHEPAQPKSGPQIKHRRKTLGTVRTNDKTVPISARSNLKIEIPKRELVFGDFTRCVG